jgi:hypothetical protein
VFVGFILWASFVDQVGLTFCLALIAVPEQYDLQLF